MEAPEYSAQSGLSVDPVRPRPRLSIIMGTYNCRGTVAAAIESILQQTFSDWEFVICDDGSSDGTTEVLSEYARKYPTKFIVLRNSSNRTLAYTLNRCLAACKGELIARMDGDDISDPRRLQTQVQYLDDNPGVDLVGTAMIRFDNSGEADVLIPRRKPDMAALRFGTPFNHATVVTYRRVFDSLNGYSELERAERCEDVDLWFRLFAHGFVGENLVEPLYRVREDLDAIRRRSLTTRFKLFQTRIAGYQLLRFPLRWYIYPAIELMKGFVPHRIVRAYRWWQKVSYENAGETHRWIPRNGHTNPEARRR